MPREDSTYRAQRFNQLRSKKAAALKAMRLAHNIPRSDLDFIRHRHPGSYRVLQQTTGAKT